MSSISGVAQDARALAQRADQLRDLVRGAGGRAQDEATRATLGRVAGRLGLSVVRPLSSALGSQGDQPPAESQDGQAELPHALHVLAVDATRLRVRAAEALSLQEAAAALQDLACQSVAEDVERLAARRTELGTLMTGLPATIQSAPERPVPAHQRQRASQTGSEWRSTRRRRRRCAAAGPRQIKPWCDGSHSQIGFDDAKVGSACPGSAGPLPGSSPSPIADNRGTCAHSGFCTDRAPTVFRVERRAVRRACGRPRRRDPPRRPRLPIGSPQRKSRRRRSGRRV